MTHDGKQFIKRESKNQRRKQQDPGSNVNALPNTYKFAAETLKIMSERGGSAGSVVVRKYKNYNYKHIFALVMNTLKNLKIIKKIIHEMKLVKRVTVDNPFLLEILVGDLLYGKGLKSIEQNTTAAVIIDLKNAIVKQRDALKKDYSTDTNNTSVAKYLRINQAKANLEHVISQLKALGLKQVDYSKDKIKFKKFINKFKSLESNEFMLDFHFPNDLIILKVGAASKLNKSDLIKKGKAMLQDKASYLAIEALDAQPNQRIIDACFAPGCKTALMAGKMKNKGKIFAFDINKKRFVEAKHLLKVQGINCVKTELLDFSKVKLKRLLTTNNIDVFDSILIDPSCSGSGIQSRVDYKSSDEEVGRLKKLQSFQVLLLKHALRANVSKSIVYCTCSTSVEENEQVIEMALNESGTKSLWDVVKILPYWPQRGKPEYTFGEQCIRSDSDNLTNGFFIAKLNRNQTQLPSSNKVKHETNEAVSGSEEELNPQDNDSDVADSNEEKDDDEGNDDDACEEEDDMNEEDSWDDSD